MSGSEVTGSPNRVMQPGPKTNTKLSRVDHKLKYKSRKIFRKK